MSEAAETKPNPWGQAWVLLASLSPFLYHPLALLPYGWAAKATEWKRAWLGNPHADPISPILNEAYFQASFPILPALGILSLALVFARLPLTRQSCRHPAWLLLAVILVSSFACCIGSYAFPLTQALEYAAVASVPLAAWTLSPDERELLKSWSLRSLALWWLICMLYCQINYDKGIGANPNWTAAALAATAPFAWLQLSRFKLFQSLTARWITALLIASVTIWQMVGPCSTRTTAFALPFLAYCLLLLKLPGWRSRLTVVTLCAALIVGTGIFLKTQMNAHSEAELKGRDDLLAKVITKCHRIEAEDIRAPLWNDAVHLALQKPILGHGPLGWLRDFPGSISENLMKKQHFSSLIEHTHNQPLMVLVELGFAGLLAWLAVLVWILHRRPADAFGWCAWSGAILLFGFGMADKPLAVAASAPIFLLLLALRIPQGPSVETASPPARALALLSLILGFFLSLLLCFAALSKLRFEISTDYAAKSFWINKATWLDRWNPDYAYMTAVYQVSELEASIDKAPELSLDFLDQCAATLDRAEGLVPGYGDLQRKRGVWATCAARLADNPADRASSIQIARQAYEKNLAFQPLAVNRLVALLEFTARCEPDSPRLATLTCQLPELLTNRVTWKSLDQGIDPKTRAAELRQALTDWQPGTDPSPVIAKLNAMIDTGKFICQGDPGWTFPSGHPNYHSLAFHFYTCRWLKASLMPTQQLPASIVASGLDAGTLNALARQAVLLCPEAQGRWRVLRPGDKLPDGPLFLADWPEAFTVQGLYAAAALSLDGGAAPPLELPSARRRRPAEPFHIPLDRIQIWTAVFEGLP